MIYIRNLIWNLSNYSTVTSHNNASMVYGLRFGHLIDVVAHRRRRKRFELGHVWFLQSRD
jgi:hypothetical protein